VTYHSRDTIIERGEYLALELLDSLHFPSATVLGRHLVLPPPPDVLTQLHLQTKNSVPLFRIPDKTTIELPKSSVTDPDPEVFGPPGSGSGSISQRLWIRILLVSSTKNSKKNLDFYCFVT
jgi:hypothetical protein